MRGLLLGVVAVVIAAATPVRAQPALPEGNGRELVAVACTQCHALGTIMKMREGATGWRTHVNNMVLRGAQLSGPEIDTVVDYLALHLGPGARLPAAKQVTLPSGDGRELVETRCGLCHDLERVVGIKRHKGDWPRIVANMVGRGATATPDEMRAMSEYLAATFGD